MSDDHLRLVATLADVSAAALPAARDAALRVADLVEFRLDRLPAQPLKDMLGRAADRAVVTCRPAREGGAFVGTEAEREAHLRAALALGAAFVDVEWDAAFGNRMIAQFPGRVVLSRHDFSGMPADLPRLVRALAARRPAIAKLAVTPGSLAELLHLRDASRAAGDVPVVLIGMGATGLPSRILAAQIGSCWTYSGAGVAPGQLPPDVMRHQYRVGRQGPATRIFGVTGRPLGHSWSPLLHNAALQALGLDAVYLPLEGRDLDDVLVFAEALGVAGLSVTAPFKVDALARAQRADALTTRLGAANTLTRQGDGWVARNTDVDGFLHPLRARLPLAGVRAAVLGAGGAARAVSAGLVLEGAQVVVHARRPEQAARLQALGARADAWPPRPGTWDLLVNTTPVGTAPDVEASPVDASALAGGGLVYDLVYNPGHTRLLRDAAAMGCQTLGGLEMLIAQAALQVATWCQVDPPTDVMRAAIHAEAPHLARTPEISCPQ